MLPLIKVVGAVISTGSNGLAAVKHHLGEVGAMWKALAPRKRAFRRVQTTTVKNEPQLALTVRHREPAAPQDVSFGSVFNIGFWNQSTHT